MNRNKDAMLITSFKNIFYQTGFQGSLGYLLVVDDNKKLFVDFRYFDQAKLQTRKRDVEIIMIPKDDLTPIYEFLRQKNIEKLGFEDSYMTVSNYEKLKKKFKDIDLIPLGDALDRKRMVKKFEEIEQISRGVAIVDQVFAETIEKILEFKTEKNVANFIEFRMKELGASAPAFDTIVAYGKNSAYPHWKASDEEIGREGFLKIDFGAIVGCYGSDMTRTIYIGNNISEKHREIYEIVKTTQQLAVEAAREGITTRDLDRIARDYITEKGYGEFFQHGLGHGLGIMGGEMPAVSNLAEPVIIEEGMCITIEPGIYIPGFGGVRIEDDVVIEANGCRVLTKSNKELMIIQL